MSLKVRVRTRAVSEKEERGPAFARHLEGCTQLVGDGVRAQVDAAVYIVLALVDYRS